MTGKVEYDQVLSGGDIELGEISVGEANVAKARTPSDAESARIRALTYTPHDNENSPSILTFTNMKVVTKTANKKVLINDVSGSITGGFWAIMGSSGGGKTTLLSTLALRLDPNYMDISGDIRLNGREYSKKTLKSMSAYVMQDDLLHAELTVWETINYAAQLRMPEGITKEQRVERQEFVLKLMGITHCKDTIVGDSRKKGISGGERKRLCVAIELLNHPKLLFLDEPTSGLDSSTALSVCQALKNLSDLGECTVVCTVHQPQPKIFNLFDNLILMKQGAIVYQGSAQKSVHFLLQLGLTVPEGDNLADFLLDCVTPGNEDEAIDGAKLSPPVDLSMGYDKQLFEETGGATSWWNQFTVLLRRNFQQYIRRPDIILLNFTATTLLALFVCLGLWRQIGTGQSSIATRAPSLFFACVCQGIIGALQSVNSFPAERAIMLRERAAGAYHVSAYFTAKSLVDTFTAMWTPIIFSCIVYGAIGYQPIARKFFLYTMFLTMNALAATSLASAVTCVCVSVELSTVVISVLFEWCRLYGGFFFSPAQFDIPRMNAWKFADALSFMKYAYVGIALNEFGDLDLSCAPGKTCQYTHGSQIIADKGYDQYTLGFCAGILVLYIFGCRIIGYLGLRFIRN